MENKEIAKRYLISISLLYIIGAAVLFIIILALSSKANIELSLLQKAGISLLCPLLPCASYAGFCCAFIGRETLSKGAIIMLAFFFPVTLSMITIYGLVMIIPSIIKGIKVIKRN